LGLKGGIIIKIKRRILKRIITKNKKNRGNSKSISGEK
jgi:hypothetical protein